MIIKILEWLHGIRNESVFKQYRFNWQSNFAECFANLNCGKPNEYGIALSEFLKQRGLLWLVKKLIKEFITGKNPAWYRPVNNSYEYELTDQAPEKARKSYVEYKDTVDEYLALFGATPYEGVIIDL